MSTSRSFSAASLRGLSTRSISAPVSRATSSARSMTRWISVIWLKIRTRSPRLGRVLDRELDAAHGVLDVDERARLAAGAVHGQRVADRGLHEEAVQHRAVVAVVVEAVDQPLVEARSRAVWVPQTMPWCRSVIAHAVVLGVEREQQLVQRLGHVVDAARVGRVEDLLLDLAAVVGVHADRQVALGDRHAGGAVAVDAHRAEVHDVGVELGLDQRGEQVVRRVDVVVDRVALVPRATSSSTARRAARRSARSRRAAAPRAGRSSAVVVLRRRRCRSKPISRPVSSLPGGAAARPAGGSASATPPRARRRRCGARSCRRCATSWPQAGQVQRRRPAAEPVAAENQNRNRVLRRCPAG